MIGFADSWPAPETAWSLLGAGFEVVAFSRRGSRPALRRSKRVEVIAVTPPEEDVSAAVEDVARAVRSCGAKALLPLDDFALWLSGPVAEGANVEVIGPGKDAADFALDKRLQVEAASRAGFAVPLTHCFDSSRELLCLSEYPVVIKRALAVAQVGPRLLRGPTLVCADRTELAEVAGKGDVKPPLIVQPFINGVGEGLFGLAGAAGVSSWSAHRRIRMVDPQGSGSSACTSTTPDPKLIASASRMLEDVSWRGLFMLEFLRDAEGRAWFLEMNGRPWGSLALARRLGLEYPAWAAVQHYRPHFRPTFPAADQRIVCRHLGFEIIHLLRVFRGPRSSALTQWPSRRDTLRNVVTVTGAHRWYNWCAKDPGVFIQDTINTIWEFIRPSRGRPS